MSDKDNEYRWILPVFCVSLILFHLGTAQVQIATKFQFPSECLDNDNVQRNHLDEWTESTGSCDRRICYIGSLETARWKILYDCPEELVPYDLTNCQYVSSGATTFPDCCRTLQCSTGSLTTVALPACYDIAAASACQVWYDETNCMNSTDDTVIQGMYNLMAQYCQNTCGLC